MRNQVGEEGEEEGREGGGAGFIVGVVVLVVVRQLRNLHNTVTISTPPTNENQHLKPSKKNETYAC